MYQNFHLSELDRRLANLIRVGTVKEADYAQARVRVQVGKLCTDWLPWVTQRAGHERSWSPPSIGEQVVLLAPCGDMGQGIVLPALYQRAYPAPSDQPTTTCLAFQDGFTLTYDKKAHELTVTLAAGGKMKISAGSSIFEMTPEAITLKAPLVRINNRIF